jgi:hypothetical protein
MLGVMNLLLAIDRIFKTEESQNTDEIESTLETLGLIGSSKLWFYCLRPKLVYCLDMHVSRQ